MKEASSTTIQANSRTAIWTEILEEADVAHQAGDRVENRTAGVDADSAQSRPGLRRSADDKSGAGCLETEPGKALEDNTSEIVPVADEIGEDADEAGSS